MKQPIRLCIFVLCLIGSLLAQDFDGVTGCGGFVQLASSLSNFNSTKPLDYSVIQVSLLNSNGVVKVKTECAPNGYYFLPIEEKGTFSIQVRGPEGWSFEPDRRSVVLGKDGQCQVAGEGKQADVNFEFIGFTVTGQVVVEGCSNGVTGGVEVHLLRASDKGLVGTTVSEKDGSYRLSKLLPGDYTVEARHKSWTLSVSQLPITISWGNVNVPQHLVISGYDIVGRIDSEGLPVHSVQFKLSDNASGKAKTTQSDDQGRYRFGNVTCGSYRVVPAYGEANSNNFRITPEFIPVDLNGGTFEISKKFHVVGFSLRGRVTTAWGLPIYNASVSINHNEQTVHTDRDGEYQLEDLKNGKFRITVSKEHYNFDELEIPLTSSTARIQSISSTGLDVCGQVALLDGDAATTNVDVVLYNEQNRPVDTRRVSADGSFCFSGVSAGKQPDGSTFSVEPKLPGSSTVFNVQRHQVVLKDQPVLDVVFSESKLHVAGKVQIGGEGDLEKSTVSLESASSSRHTEIDFEGNFHFDAVPPGDYNLKVNTPAEHPLCWERETIKVVLKTNNVSDVVFKPTGHKISLESTHAAKLRYSHGAEKGEREVPKGDSSFCVDSLGDYSLQLSSCFRFEEDTIAYDTRKPHVVSLKVSKFVLTGQIPAISGGPAAIDIYLGGEKGNSTVQATIQDGAYQYQTLVSRGESVVVIPHDKSDTFLFYPHSRTYQTHNNPEGCLPSVPDFDMRKGFFASGSVLSAGAPTSDVTILLRDSDTPEVYNVSTSADGSFRVGPLRHNRTLTVTPFRQGFEFEPTSLTLDTSAASSPLTIKGTQLGRIQVLISDSNGNPLPGVLLSLSGSPAFRQNNITTAAAFNYWAMKPNQYFLRPLLKEYTFDPSSLSINLQQGEQKEVRFATKRISFSLFGDIRSINGDSSPGVTVQAVSLSDGKDSAIEEAKSDTEGAFRLRGLFPNRTYRLQVKVDDDSQAVRTIPEYYDLQTTASDTRNLNFTLYRCDPLHDITGTVTAEVKRISLLRNDDAVASRDIGPSRFFEFRNLPRGVYQIDMYNHGNVRSQQRVVLQHNSHVDLTPDFAGASEQVFESPTSFGAFIVILAVIIAAIKHKQIRAGVEQYFKSPSAKEESWLPKGMIKQKSK